MEKKRNKYSIRKFAVGASSILIGSLLFLNVGTVEAAGENNQSEADAQVQNGNHLGDEEHQNLVNDNTNTPVNNDKTQVNDEKVNQATHTSLHKDQQNSKNNVNDSTDKVKEQEASEVDPEFNAKDKVKEQEASEVDPEFNAKDKEKEQEASEVDPEFNAKDKEKEQEAPEVDPEFNAKDKEKEQKASEIDPEFNAKDKEKEQKASEIDPEFNAEDKLKQQEAHVDYKDAKQNKVVENNQTPLNEPVKNDENKKEGTSLDKLPNQTANHDSEQDNKDNPDKALNTLKENAVATPKNQTQQNVEKASEQPNKTAKQGQYQNQDPII